MLLYNNRLTNEFRFICTFVIAFLRCSLNLHLPVPVLIMLTSKKFSFCDWPFFSFVYYIALFSVYLKYSENYETVVLSWILCGCLRHIFYIPTELKLSLEFLILFYLLNTVWKLQKSQPLTLSQSDLSFAKYPCDYQKQSNTRFLRLSSGL